jgi:hypothetical protein
MTTTETKSRPIIMSGESVRSIIAGKKNQTRRIVKAPRDKLMWDLSRAWADKGFPDADGEYRSGYLHVPFAHRSDGWAANGEIDAADRVYCPHEVGDQLWVKEKVYLNGRPGDVEKSWIYAADVSGTSTKARSPLFMPRKCSRLTLEITSVRAEKLQSISAADAIAEGCPLNGMATPRVEFMYRWQTLNGRKSGANWEDNPFVWCLSFKLTT